MPMEAEDLFQIFVFVSIFGATLFAGTTQCSRKKPPHPPVQPAVVVSTAPDVQVPAEVEKDEKSKKEKSKKSEKTKSVKSKDQTSKKVDEKKVDEQPGGIRPPENRRIVDTHDPNYQTLAHLAGDVFGEDKKKPVSKLPDKKEQGKKEEVARTTDPNYQTLAFVGENAEVFGKDKKVEAELKVEPTKDETKDDEQKAADKPKEMKAEEMVEKKVDVAKVDDKKPEPAKNVDIKPTEAVKNDDAVGKDKKVLDDKKVVKKEMKDKKEPEAKKANVAIKDDKKQEPPKNTDIKAPADVNKKAHTYDPNYQTLAQVGKNDAVFGKDKKVTEPKKEDKKIEPVKVDEKKPEQMKQIQAPANQNLKAHTYDPNYQTLAMVGKNDAVFGKDKKVIEGKKEDKKVEPAKLNDKKPVVPNKIEEKKPEPVKQIQAPADVNKKAHTYDPQYQNDVVFGKDKKIADNLKDGKKIEPAKVDDKKQEPPKNTDIKAPADVNKKAHTYDPNYQTLAMVGKNDAVFGKDKKTGDKPKMEPAKLLPTNQEKKEVKK
ncbi:hypothetical protein M3Y96_01142600 [Aphelenchoides besseyi]|nr:hypothetical protein M3Y96_01142600 [Aphelenchoides besseyi]